MRLLDKLVDYATVDLTDGAASHADDDEIGDRIAMNRPNGHVDYILLVHTISTSINGSTYNLECMGAASAAATLETEWAQSMTYDFTPGGLQDESIAFAPRAANTICMMYSAGYIDLDFMFPHLVPFVTYVLDIDSTTGVFVTDAYLYGA